MAAARGRCVHAHVAVHATTDANVSCTRPAGVSGRRLSGGCASSALPMEEDDEAQVLSGNLHDEERALAHRKTQPSSAATDGALWSSPWLACRVRCSHDTRVHHTRTAQQ